MGMKKEHFRQKIIKYLDQHWETTTDTGPLLALFGYSDRYFQQKFKGSFDMPFYQYLTKYKLHRTAQEIKDSGSLTNAGKRAGFATAQSFSKAFKKEFDLSPRAFLRAEAGVPDMPPCYSICGNPVEIVYRKESAFSVAGHPVMPPKGESVDYLRKRGYSFLVSDPNVDTRLTEEEKIGMWWHSAKQSMCYVLGTKQYNISEGMLEIKVPEETYAVFSIACPEVLSGKAQLSEIMYELSEFAIHEWAVINRRYIKQFSIVFESYSSRRIALYLPIEREPFDLSKNPEEGPEAWTRYIDKHLLCDLKISEIAEHFNYSPTHFLDTFSMYYNMTPTDYIKKRKLYLSAHEIKRNKKGVKEIIAKYGFRSVEAFRTAFYEEFHVSPEEYGEKGYEESISSFYRAHKHILGRCFEELGDFYLSGHEVVPEEMREKENVDLLECIVAALENAKNHKSGEKKKTASKYVVWQNQYKGYENVCLVGEEEEHAAGTDDDALIEIKGGDYVVLSTREVSDKENLAETYRLLYRCAFAGWIREHRARVDFSRLTFICYKNKKLYFYIPLNE